MLIEACDEAYRLKFSCDNILNLIFEFENLKKVVLNEEQRYVFRFAWLPTIIQIFEEIKYNKNFDIDTHKLEYVLNKMMVSEDNMTKSLLRLI